jgi:hypothetical protein
VGPLAADNHSIGTLLALDDRAGWLVAHRRHLGEGALASVDEAWSGKLIN